MSVKKKMIQRVFQECHCGISVAIDGSEDHLIIISGLEGYQVINAEEEDDLDFEIVSSSDED